MAAERHHTRRIGPVSYGWRSDGASINHTHCTIAVMAHIFRTAVRSSLSITAHPLDEPVSWLSRQPTACSTVLVLLVLLLSSGQSSLAVTFMGRSIAVSFRG